MIKLFDYQRDPKGNGYDYIICFSKDVRSKEYLGHYIKAIGDIKDKKLDADLKLWRINQDGFNYLKRMEMAMNDSRHPNDIKTCSKIIQDPIFGSNSVVDKIRNGYAKPKIQKQSIVEEDDSKFVIEQVNNQVTDYENMGSHLKFEPYIYQKEIIKFCLEKENALIVAPCGAGKTPMMLGTYDEAKRAGKIKGPGIIVVKASLKNQWKEEVDKFTGYKSIIVKTFAKMKKNQEDFENQFKDNDLYILNYETLRDEKIRAHIKKLNPDFMACDEIQYIKSHDAKRSKAVQEFNDIRFRIGATATPVMKNSFDIFGIFKFINPSMFPKVKSFKDEYVKTVPIPGTYAEKIIGSKNMGKLNKEIAPYMIIKSKEEVSKHLPGLQIIRRNCYFTSKQQKMNDKIFRMLDDLHQEEYNVMRKLAVVKAKSSEELESIKSRILMYQSFAQMLAVDEKLLETSGSSRAKEFITNSPSNKVEMAIELIKEIVDSGEKVTIFSRFVHTADILKEIISKDDELKQYKVAVVNGSLSAEKRYDQLYTKFRDDDNYKILICSDAAAEGVNLSKCRYLIEMDLAQSYAFQTQRHGRIERADSIHETVYVYQLLYLNSYDDIAMKIIDKKEKDDRTIVKGMEE